MAAKKDGWMDGSMARKMVEWLELHLADQKESSLVGLTAQQMVDSKV